MSGEVKSQDEAVAKASPKWALESLGLDAKRDDLPLARMKRG